jgi:putative inorganic carbon (hco3(-)) transporter
MMRFKETERYRLAQYRTTVIVLGQHPLLGVGFGNFTRVFDQYKAPETPASYVRTTENMYLMVACESGGVGLVAFLSLLGAIGTRFLRAFHREQDPGLRRLRLAFLASFSAMLVNMVFWDALNFPTIRLLFWFVAGIGMVEHTSEEISGHRII